VKPWVAGADVLTALRLPLAAAFPVLRDPIARAGVILLAAGSDLADGVLARRYGSSRIGPVLDPLADKIFMAVAFVTVARSGALAAVDVVGVLLRDILAVAGFVGSAVLRRPLALPARAGGKAVTVGQVVTLLAAVAGARVARPLAWVTAVLGLYAIWDYGRAARRVMRS
jgi:phosphatidylglycerophosphate synthase